MLQIRNYSQIESIIRQKINAQTGLQVEQVKENFNLLHTNLLRAAFEIENNHQFYDWLTEPVNDETEGDTKKREIETELAYINSRSMPNSVFVYFALVDLSGRVYTSYNPLQPLQAASVTKDPGFAMMAENGESFIWLDEEMGDIGVSSHSERQLALLSVLRNGSDEPFGFLRISFDYDSWLKSIVRDFSVLQNYFILDAEGNVLSRTRSSAVLDPEWIERLRQQRGQLKDYFDRGSNTLLNVQQLTDMNWKLVSQFPFDSYIGDINEMNRRYLTTFTLLIGLFVVVTFVILSRMTRPLQLLQRKMEKSVSSHFRDRIQLNRMDGEVLALAMSFNRMASDIQALIAKLKLEEKQKEAMHFQMLLTQMNPHFLLNTLNMVKWQAVRSGQDDIAETCLNLGKLLENSLNTNVDLIFAKDELELVRAYVQIMQKRWRYPFDVIYELEPALTYVLVPKLSLQLLVENCIHHGFSKLTDQGRIEIRMRIVGRELCIEIRDNGVGLKRAEEMKRLSKRKRDGIGLNNLRERLRLLYKGGGALYARRTVPWDDRSVDDSAACLESLYGRSGPACGKSFSLKTKFL
ncbi:sensor histidine kinase [Cohnella rhizosphaerae]|uniref:sensor histidine kinase n=1 Tax=Cohnella rhizosphaerae TaxID=1457232 RepID=UPI003B8A7EBA